MKSIDYDRLERILSEHYRDELVSTDEVILLDYMIFDKYYPVLTEALTENYMATAKSIERYIRKMRIQQKKTKIRFVNVNPQVKLEKIHQRYNNRFICFEGIVKKRSTVYNQITHVHWTCKQCLNDYVYKLDYNEKLTPPNTSCKNCGRKAGYELNRKNSRYDDVQLFILEEDQNKQSNSFQPTQIKCYLKNDMVNQVKPGDKIRANGIVELQNHGKNNHFQEFVTIKNIEKLEKNFEDIKISAEEKEEIEKLAGQENIFERITGSITPSIFGYDELKLALALHLFSSPNAIRSGSYKRGDIHILLVGDPSLGKSQILKYVSKLAPHGIYTSGKGSSGAGLTATTVKDEQGNWSLEAGAMVLANNGNICIDEFDKMKEEDRSAIHEALEQQTISISKAGINTTLNSRCSVVAAANPKYGRFNKYKNIAEQINLSPPILSRFDLIFVLTDDIDKENDKMIAMKILGQCEDEREDEISQELLRKYISHARSINPVIDDEEKKYIAKFFCECRNLAKENHHPIPVTARQLEAIARLSKASARIRLSDKVTREDIERAIKLQKYCMKHVGFDTQTSTLEADKVMGNPTQEERTQMQKIEDEVEKLQDKWGNTIPQHILLQHLQVMGHKKEKIRLWIKENLDKMIFYDEINNTYTLIT